ncbi:MAG: prepilin-type N-terminal cleavage/methylation domain-containing protein [Proteobacteria bacterium]|nr:prepilin-type N-terminal cleavage/methylation domain-containing protein [Pseudomonadota bacterium]
MTLKKNIGFTLLEVILSITLSSLLLLTVYFTYFGINRSVDAASEGREVLEAGPVLLELIKQDLRGVAPPPKSQFISKIQDREEEKPSHRIDFITTSAMGDTAFGLSVVGYFTYNIPDKKEKIFVRRESKDIKNELVEGGINYELSNIITSFKLAFYDGENWVDEWDSRTLGKMPKQVRIMITLKDEKGFSKEFISDETIPSALY